MANVIVSIFRYWYGVATYRLAKIQGALGMGLPEGSQYKMIHQVYEAAVPVYEHLIFQVAQGNDTWARILDWLAGKGSPTKKAHLERKPQLLLFYLNRQTIVLYMRQIFSSKIFLFFHCGGHTIKVEKAVYSVSLLSDRRFLSLAEGTTEEPSQKKF